MMILDQLRAGNYQPSQYRSFTIYEPKERLILALPFRDRVVHQWYVEEFLIPFFVPRMSVDSFACIVGRGVHKAVNRIHGFMRQMRREHPEGFYIVKLDIAGFFYSIDRDILWQILAKKIGDRRMRDLTHKIIFEAPAGGIPIGNYTSQYFANLYMDQVDQFVKRQLKVKYYVRYMDDFVCLVPDRQTARRVYEAVEKFVDQRLNLRLNPKSHYYPSRFGLDFCGLRLHFDYKLLRPRAKASLRRILRNYRRGGNVELLAQRYAAWRGHASHADSYTYRLQNMYNYMDIISEHWAGRRSDKSNKGSPTRSPA
jgi:hypothetical protein